jgi:ABC-type oligopeptide transport system ATPase subunit
MTALVETKNLKKHYQMGDTVVRGLDGVSIGVVEREFVALLGTSGSGKSTPLNFRLRVSITTSGSLRIDGSDIAGLSAEGLSRHRRQTVGIIFPVRQPYIDDERRGDRQTFPNQVLPVCRYIPSTRDAGTRTLSKWSLTSTFVTKVCDKSSPRSTI